MAERRRSAHAGDDQNNGGTPSAKKPRDPQSSYLYRSVVLTRRKSEPIETAFSGHASAVLRVILTKETQRVAWLL